MQTEFINCVVINFYGGGFNEENDTGQTDVP